MKEYQTTSAREDIERTVKHKDHNYLRSKPRGLMIAIIAIFIRGL